MTGLTTEAKDKEDGLPSLSREAVNEIADAAMAELRARLGRPPTLADVQVMMAELVAESMRRLHEKEGAVISVVPPNVEGSHDEDDRVPGARTPSTRRGRPG